MYTKYGKLIEFYKVLAENVFIPNKIGLQIKHLRIKKGIDQKGFAFDCNISRTQLHLIEKGQVNLRLGTLRKIIFELDMTLSEFFTVLEKENPEIGIE